MGLLRDASRAVHESNVGASRAAAKLAYMIFGPPPQLDRRPTDSGPVRPVWTVDILPAGRDETVYEHTDRKVLVVTAPETSATVRTTFTHTCRKSVSTALTKEHGLSGGAELEVKSLIKAKVGTERGRSATDQTGTEEQITMTESHDVHVRSGGRVEVAAVWQRHVRHGEALVVDCASGRQVRVPFTATLGLSVARFTVSPLAEED